MIEHIVIFKWKPGTSKETIEAAEAGLMGLKNKIPGIIEMTCGDNFSSRSQGYEFGLLVRFTDREALEAYGPHPLHQQVVQTLIAPFREDVIAVDYEIDAVR